MDGTFNRIVRQDCISGMNSLPEGCANLVFADPPFNIGYEYDVYQDSVAQEEYLSWSRAWISAVHRVLARNGTFWLAIGDENAAELKVESQRIGFHCRSWVIWYYTFGVNCSRKFSRSHAHLFHFVKDPRSFVFREDDRDNRIPSARQLVYNDQRANPRGRLPDDTWIIPPTNVVGELISDDGDSSFEQLEPPSDEQQTWTLRPQDLAGCFKSDEDVWYFPRVAGTFKERAGFHGCQMPEQLLGRIIRTCSQECSLILDPFSGSATTLAVAKKLGRRFLGFEISVDYVKLGRERVDAVRVGDPLDGSPEPLLSAPSTGGPRNQRRSPRDQTQVEKNCGSPQRDEQRIEAHQQERQLELTLRGIYEAFRETYEGFSADRIVADPTMNKAFVSTCEQRGLVGGARTWNMLLFRLRKAGKLVDCPTTQRTGIPWERCDHYLFASEIAWQILLDEGVASSLDEILCDPAMAEQFDRTAHRFAPGFTSLEYRWAALKLRKQAKLARTRGSVLTPPSRLGKTTALTEFDANVVPAQPGVYVLSEPRSKVYVGESLNLRERLLQQFESGRRESWAEYGKLQIQIFKPAIVPAEMLAWQSCFVEKYKPRLNVRDLRATS